MSSFTWLILASLVIPGQFVGDVGQDLAAQAIADRLAMERVKAELKVFEGR